MEQLQLLTLILIITTIITMLLLVIGLTPLVGQVNRASINIHTY